jgi:hypothetical protein
MPVDFTSPLNVTLYDRVEAEHGKKREFMFNSIAFVIAPGKSEISLNRDLAKWVYRDSEVMHVHTTDGRYLCRFGIKDAEEDFVRFLGDECLDCSPLEIDYADGEGWDHEVVDRQGRVEIRKVAGGIREARPGSEARADRIGTGGER